MATENGLNIALCDDVEVDRQQILLLAREILDRKGIRACISTYESAGALLDAVHGGVKFNILLLDVLMEEMDGMELAEHLRAKIIAEEGGRRQQPGHPEEGRHGNAEDLPYRYSLSLL